MSLKPGPKIRNPKHEIPGPDLLRREGVIQMLPQYMHHGYGLIPPRRARAGLNKFKCPKSKIQKSLTLFLRPVYFEKILFWYLKIVISILFRISIFGFKDSHYRFDED